MPVRKRETIKEFTERAIEATDLGKLIPPIVYLPSRLRMNNKRVTIDNIRVTTEPPTILENHLRIQDADPVGFLIAMQNGQPIPCFEITNDGAIKVRYEIADLTTRKQIAEFLTHKVTLRGGMNSRREQEKAPEDWNAIVQQREEAIRARGQG